MCKPIYRPGCFGLKMVTRLDIRDSGVNGDNQINGPILWLLQAKRILLGDLMHISQMMPRISWRFHLIITVDSVVSFVPSHPSGLSNSRGWCIQLYCPGVVPTLEKTGPSIGYGLLMIPVSSGYHESGPWIWSVFYMCNKIEFRGKMIDYVLSSLRHNFMRILSF